MIFAITDDLFVYEVFEMANDDFLAVPDHLSAVDKDSLQALIDNGEVITYEDGILEYIEEL